MLSPSTLTREPVADATLYTAADVARPARCHPNTVKKIAAELRMEIIRTPSGCRLFTNTQAERIRAELERRRIEAMR
jgi:DNA-binding transcriptional regulator YhcF (GntR family)